MSRAVFQLVSGVERLMQGRSSWKKTQGCLRRSGLLFALVTVFLFPSLQAAAQQLAPVYVMNTLAGTGGGAYQTAPSSGDGGPATSAGVNVSTPSDVVEDKYGNVFFLDDYNCVARVIYHGGAQSSCLRIRRCT